MDSEFSIDLAGVPGHLSLGFGQGWNRRKLREVENGAESASCDFSALAIKEKSAQEEEGEGGLLRRMVSGRLLPRCAAASFCWLLPTLDSTVWIVILQSIVGFYVNVCYF